nr:DMT family transporter [Paenibacillus antri]
MVVLGAVVIWGLSYIVMKAATTDYPQLLFQFWRYAAVTAIFAAAFHRTLRLIPAHVWKIGLLRLGLANFVLGIFSIYAVQHTTPTRVVVINGLIIGVVPLLRWIHERIKPARHEGWAIGIALFAIALLFEPQDRFVQLGDVLAFVGMIGYAYSIVLTNRLLATDRASVMQVSFLGVAGCAAYFTVAAVIYVWFSPGGLEIGALLTQPKTIAGIAYMILFVSLAANLLQVIGQRRLPPVTVSILFCLEPAVTAALDYSLLGNPPSVRVTLCGIVLIGATVVAALQNGRRGVAKERQDLGI